MAARRSGAPAWREAAAGYRFAFPRDHASHPDYKLEWWYYTGNLETSAGRRFGYQVTFFRVGVDPAPVEPVGLGGARPVHGAPGRQRPGRRPLSLRREAHAGRPGLSGAETDRYQVWNEDWRAGLDDRGRHTIHARGRNLAVELVLDEGKPPAINGIDGISQKGAQAGNASHYYSLTRMPTRGSLTVDGERFDVTGESWMDHEFGTSFLEPEQQGWDWLSIQLGDGRELMLYQLRRGDGSRDPRSSGTLVDRDGPHHAPRCRRASRWWRRVATFGSTSGATYPIGWTVSVPGAGLVLDGVHAAGEPGAGHARGRHRLLGGAGGRRRHGARRRVSGRGYLEMTGYKGSLGRVMTPRS